MEQINASRPAVDYTARSQDSARPRPVPRAPPPKSRSDDQPPVVTANGHMREYLQATKSPEIKHREADQQVTQQRAQDMARGTMFDLRA